MNYHLLNGSVVLNYEGKTEVIAKDDPRYLMIVTCIREGNLEDIKAIVESTVDYFGRKGIDLVDGVVTIDGQALSHELSDRILAYKEEDLPFDSLLMFWDNLKQNPSFNARQMLFMFLEHNGHPLTQDGCFIAYRGTSEDFKDRHSGKFDNSVGSVCEMPRYEVDDNPDNTCSNGLHVACHDYAYNWAGSEGHTVEVKVNPMDVACVPNDYEGTKMRVCKFEVVGISEGERTETVYPEDDCEDAIDVCGSCVEDNCDECDYADDDVNLDDFDICFDCGNVYTDCVCQLDDSDTDMNDADLNFLQKLFRRIK